MKYTAGNPDELKSKFWTALADSAFVFLQRDANPASAVPMTAQLDPKADSAIWFFTSKGHDLALPGQVTATFASKDHDLFARFSGTLAPERDQGRFDKFWSNFVKAWYDEGKDDPQLAFMRMDLGDAEIWSAEMGVLTTAKMMLGQPVRDDMKEQHVETTL